MKTILGVFAGLTFATFVAFHLNGDEESQSVVDTSAPTEVEEGDGSRTISFKLNPSFVGDDQEAFTKEPTE